MVAAPFFGYNTRRDRGGFALVARLSIQSGWFAVRRSRKKKWENFGFLSQAEQNTTPPRMTVKRNFSTLAVFRMVPFYVATVTGGDLWGRGLQKNKCAYNCDETSGNRRHVTIEKVV